ncbi:MAG: hypothetical protein HDS11_04285 [Bacteroides sp.]|nr:hypothetical protein [Bacteroides sp.]
MPNKRNKNRDKIAVSLSEDKRPEINEYLATQHSIKDTVELALLLAKKTFGNKDLKSAYQDYALSMTPGPILNGNPSSKTISKVETKQVKEGQDESNNSKSEKSNHEQPKSEKKPLNKRTHKPKVIKKNKVIKETNKQENNSSNKLDPKAINQLFDNGNMSDL